MRRTLWLIAVLGLPCWSGLVWAEDWPRFRGPNGSAVSNESAPPTNWSDTENLRWKIGLPGPGSSSPIVVGDRVFVTCYSGYGDSRSNPGRQDSLSRHLLCVRMSDGQVLWQKSVRAVLPEDPYQGMLTEHGYASSTPAADGERVYVFFGKSGVLAFDFDGNPLWQASVGTGSAIMGWGSAASLTLHKNLVIVNANAESEALVALDKATGRVVWKSETKGYAGSWSTPILVDVEGRQELVVFMPGEIWALHPDDGTLAWFCSGLRGSATSSLVSRDGIVFAASGGPGGSGAVAVRAGGNDEVNSSRVLWRASVGSYVPSPALVGKHLFWVDDRGVATCLAAESGEQVYRERLPGAGGHYASVVAADGKLFAVSRRNGTFVLEAKPEFKVLAHNRIQSDSSDFNASPAISNDALLLRSNRSLYRLGASGATR